MSRRVPCFNPDCWSRRVHHEMPDVPRGQVFIDVPDDWDGYGAFCSMMCAIESGYMSLTPTAEPCKKCFVFGKGYLIHHHGTWKCVRPEVTEEEFQQFWGQREESLRAFREKLAKGEFGQ